LPSKFLILARLKERSSKKPREIDEVDSIYNDIIKAVIWARLTTSAVMPPRKKAAEGPAEVSAAQNASASVSYASSSLPSCKTHNNKANNTTTQRDPSPDAKRKTAKSKAAAKEEPPQTPGPDDVDTIFLSIH
jgi:hypothetical protein